MSKSNESGVFLQCNFLCWVNFNSSSLLTLWGVKLPPNPTDILPDNSIRLLGLLFQFSFAGFLIILGHFHYPMKYNNFVQSSPVAKIPLKMPKVLVKISTFKVINTPTLWISCGGTSRVNNQLFSSTSPFVSLVITPPEVWTNKNQNTYLIGKKEVG